MQNIYDYIVIGAGMAGLSFAYEMQKKGYKILILEKDSTVGGLSKTLSFKGFKFDYCAHRFHSDNPKVMQIVKEIMKENFFLHKQKSRILMFDRYLKYPFELQNFLRAIPINKALIGGMSFLSSIIKRIFIRRTKFLSYEDWFSYYFGYHLYNLMSKDYTSKIWKTDPKYISSDWASQRFRQIKLIALLKKIFIKIFKFDFSSYSLEDESLAPDGGPFWYPQNGIQDIPNEYCKLIKKSNSDIFLNCKISYINLDEKKVFYKKKNDSDLKEVIYKNGIISTIPLGSLYEALNIKNQIIENNLKEITYMDIIFVYLIINKKKISNDHWLYFPDKKIIFNRAVEFKNWSIKMAPEHQTAICLDISTYRSNASKDNPWMLNKSELIQRCVNDSVKVNLINKEDFHEGFVVKVKDAYPFYDLNYKVKIKSIIEFFEKNTNLYCIGRTGSFSYNNSDGSIEMGIDLAEKLFQKASTPKK